MTTTKPPSAAAQKVPSSRAKVPAASPAEPSSSEPSPPSSSASAASAPSAPSKSSSKASSAAVPPSSSSPGIILALVVIVISCLAAYWISTGSSPLVPVQSTPRSNAPGYDIVGKVQVVQWEPGKKFSKEISTSRKPVVLKNTMVKNWPALKKWNPKYLADNVETLLGVYQHNNKTFTFYDDSKPYGAFDGVKEDLSTSHKIVSLDTRQFFVKAAQAMKGPQSTYYYYSGPLNDFGKTLRDDLPNLEYLATKEGKDVFYSVWMGYNGTTAHTHYDIFNNFNVQLYGTKKFILSPPSEWEKLYLYPRHHPSYRQSQVNLDAPDINEFPLCRSVTAYEVILEPGDVLYLPPYWGHRVVSVDTSISVNSFSDSTETIVFYEILKIPLGFIGKLESKQLQAAALRVFINDILQKTLKNEDAKAFFKMLYHTRYEHLFDTLNEQADTDVCAPAKLPEGFLSQSKEIAATVAKLFNSIPEPIRRISLGNYFEDISKGFLGIENVAAFMKCGL